ncbi:MAG: aldo/keto reductase [Pseudomonadota bacterium]
MTDMLKIARERSVAGRTIGRLAYGCWRFAGSTMPEAREKVEAALSIGANLLDTADIYGFGAEGFGDAELRLGALLAESPGLREEVVLVTKGGVQIPGPYNSRGDYLVSACEASLSRLGVEAVDIYLVHRPDLLASPQEVAAALSRLLADGKVHSVGVSNYTPGQTRALQAMLDVPLVACQPEISLLEPSAFQDGVLDLAQEMEAMPMAWSPLRGGRLFNPEDAQSIRVAKALTTLAEAQETSVDAVALAWLLAHPAGIVPILGSQTPARIRAAAAAYDVKLTGAEWYALLEASLGTPMP